MVQVRVDVPAVLNFHVLGVQSLFHSMAGPKGHLG